MKSIPLSRGHFALVSDEDHEMLSGWAWYARPGSRYSRCFYAARKDGKRTIYMHREIMSPPDGVHIDHANCDGLDNRRENLRVATPSQNMTNYRRPNKQGLRGITVNCGGWQGVVQRSGVRRRGPRRVSIIHAAFDYDRLALETYGPFAVLNFPCLAKTVQP